MDVRPHGWSTRARVTMRDCVCRYREPSLTRLGLGADVVNWEDEELKDEDVPPLPLLASVTAASIEQQQQQEQHDLFQMFPNMRGVSGDFG